MIKYLVWDFDGVICDSREEAFKCHNIIAKKYNNLPKIYTPDDYVSVFSEEFDVSLEKYLKKEKISKYFYLHRTLLSRYKKQFKLFSDVLYFINEFNCKSIILTSTSERLVKEILSRNNVDYKSLFNFILGRETPGKKHEKLCNLYIKFSLSPKEIIYIGDTLNDVYCCNIANVPIICVGYGYSPASAFYEKKILYFAETSRQLVDFLKNI